MTSIDITTDSGTKFKVNGEWDGQRFYIDGIEYKDHDVSYLLDLCPGFADDISDKACMACGEREQMYADFQISLQKEGLV